MGQRDMRSDIRQLHGDEVEIVEMEPAEVGYRHSGKRYVVSAPELLPGWPTWLRVLLGILAFAIASVLLLVGVGGVLFGLFILWTVLWPK